MTHTPHATDCRKVFGRFDPSCPRCKELLAGAPRREWSTTRRARFDAQPVRDIREHDCKRSHCGPVCTFGEW
jgi:hypothetical protein